MKINIMLLTLATFGIVLLACGSEDLEPAEKAVF
jgi:hypothetical protein